MQIKNSMKSVLAQGATVVKAIEEALKKADMPQEFFVKILEEAQSGFLGFGAKKAKIALFFKKETYPQRGDGVLSQDSYQDLFNNQSLQKQIDNQQRELPLSKDTKPVPIVPKHQAPQQAVVKKPNQFQQRELRSIQPQNRDNKPQIKENQPLKENQPHARPQHVRPLDKTDRPQRPGRRIQDTVQRPMTPRTENSSSNNSGKDITSASDQSVQERSQRSNNPNRRRSRYFSPRHRQGGSDGGSSNSSTPKNNNDSNNS